MVTVEQFSEKYSLLTGVRIFEYAGDRFLMDFALYESLVEDFLFTDPTIKLTRGHYKPRESDKVLADSVAIPEHIYSGEDLLLLNDSQPDDAIHEFF